MNNPTDAWIDMKGLIDHHCKSYPLYQGTIDITEVEEIARIADEHDLSDKQYDALIDKSQAYTDEKIGELHIEHDLSEARGSKALTNKTEFSSIVLS